MLSLKLTTFFYAGNFPSGSKNVFWNFLLGGKSAERIAILQSVKMIPLRKIKGSKRLQLNLASTI